MPPIEDIEDGTNTARQRRERSMPSINEEGEDNDTQSPSEIELANAEHLDHLESSDQIDDIASFQDIELPPAPPPDADTESVITETGNGEQQSNIVRRAKRFYYLRPMIIQYKYPLAGCVLVCVAILVAIGFSASYIKNNGPTYSSKDPVDTTGFIVNDAPNDDVGGWKTNDDGGYYGYDFENEEVGEPLENDNVDTITQPERPPAKEDNNLETGEADEEVGDPLENTANVITQPPRGDSTPSPSPPLSMVNLIDSMQPTVKEETEDPLLPKWFTTTGVQYQLFLSSISDQVEKVHAYDAAGLFCQSQQRELCSYHTYCPNGQGNNPYPGGAPLPEAHSFNSLEESQWAPFNTHSNAQEMDWVQIGTIPTSMEGNEDNDYGRCYEYNKWTNYLGGDIEERISEDNRRWILCCEKGSGDDDVEDGDGI